MFSISKEDRIAIIGLGYVGLPLAVEFGKSGTPVIGFDIDAQRIAELERGLDRTREVSSEEIAAATTLTYTADIEALRGCKAFIVTVPTPINRHKQPDFTPLERASETIGKVLAAGAVVIYESTVYPGATEEICVPILERESGLRFNEDFYAGYSPERINPGDKVHRVANIMKVVSGSTPEVAEAVEALYRRIIQAGTHRTSSIRVAEAAKVIENTQRDLNIALINELSLIFNRLGIDTLEVLEAAGTKWNFLPFRPGLVGGHCISVDPYYLTHKAQEIGYYPKVILSGRQINDGMGAHIASEVIKMLTQRRIHVVGANILVLGLAFKENCPDLRNTRVVDIVAELESYHAMVDVHDPWVDGEEAEEEYGITPIDTPVNGKYDAIILAVAHDDFRELGADGIRAFGRKEHILYDIKSVLPKAAVDARL
ncbi:MAG: Vi polysaccharide biosynthesis UDP-N-acetylglucosamine C-6 dehydrogenase TviB [Gammaproteobacteria bacterium]|nr:MAG: Vi polysaccharide biosynthesis UDP-N-acetylglucosamine C-6 dehydrogenase TviB [Gammaproteobacteria bacterium]